MNSNSKRIFKLSIKAVMVASVGPTLFSSILSLLYSLSNSVFEIVQDEDNWDVGDEATVSEIILAIDQLPVNYRVVVQLFLLEGYDHNEISGILSISENSSRTNLHRGKAILKETLKHLQYGTGS